MFVEKKSSKICQARQVPNSVDVSVNFDLSFQPGGVQRRHFQLRVVVVTIATQVAQQNRWLSASQHKMKLEPLWLACMREGGVDHTYQPREVFVVCGYDNMDHLFFFQLPPGTTYDIITVVQPERCFADTTIIARGIANAVGVGRTLLQVQSAIVDI